MSLFAICSFSLPYSVPLREYIEVRLSMLLVSI